MPEQDLECTCCDWAGLEIEAHLVEGETSYWLQCPRCSAKLADVTWSYGMPDAEMAELLGE